MTGGRHSSWPFQASHGAKFISYQKGTTLKFVRGENDYRFSRITSRESDVKPCLSRLELAENLWIMSIGRLDFRHHLDDRSFYYDPADKNLTNRLNLGWKTANPLAYLSSSLGVTALLVTTDSKFIFGERRDISSHHTSRLIHGISGYCELGPNLFYQLRPEEDLFRELNEETGITKKLVREFKLLGLSFHDMYIGANFVYLVEALIESSYFQEGGPWTEAIDASEHSSFLVCSRKELSAFLHREDLHYATKGGIAEWLRSNR